MNVQIWHVVSFAVVFTTFVLQIINFSRYYKDGENTIRFILMIKEIFLMIHIGMLAYGRTEGIFLTLAVICLFVIYLKGEVKT